MLSENKQNQSKLPTVIAGPIVRHVSPSAFTIWLVTSAPFDASTSLKLWSLTDVFFDQPIDDDQDVAVSSIRVGTFCWIHLIALSETALPSNERIFYDLSHQDESLFGSKEITYQSESHPSFFIPKDLKKIWHGSCRKPHHDSDDALVSAASHLEAAFDSGLVKGDTTYIKPDAFFMTGDQLYCDDVASPMLLAIHQVMAKLELFDEAWDDAKVSTTQELLRHGFCYNKRHQLLPDDTASQTTYEQVFKGARKPIFTSSHANNHSITLSEIIAQYLLIWSDIPWQWVDLHNQNPVYQAAVAENFSEKDRDLAQKHTKELEQFREGLPLVRQLFAHLPIYMIFDDHDVTDDWNLTRGWEEAAYGNGFSKRIIGNAVLAYGLCQGAGNAPSQHWPLLEKAKQHFTDSGVNSHNEIVDYFLQWSQWDYALHTYPKVVVLDTRTHRWRSESNANKPSGLMDWESLSQLQQALIGQDRVIIISPAPMFGVKLIESIQRIFSFFGYPLLVDAENWMSHPGAANVLLNIFRHKKTPPEFMILSGDVHYSFTYDVRIRQQKQGAKIIQFTSSGLKNTFPEKLLSLFDTLNHYLYASWSPLNWFTKRRKMHIKSRHFEQASREELLNGGGYGEVVLNNTLIDADINVVSKDHVYRFDPRD